MSPPRERTRRGRRPSVPARTKRKLRKEAGFGCVVCGNPIVEYHHIVPWAERRHFDPEHMTILCPNDHALATNGTLSREQVYEAKRAPANSTTAEDRFQFIVDRPEIVVGTISVRDCREILRIGRVPILRTGFHPRQGLVLDASLFTRDGRPLLRIWRNEWRAQVASAWDLTYTGKELKVWHRPRDVGFHLIWDPGNGTLTLYGAFEYDGVRIVCDKTGVKDVIGRRGFSEFAAEGFSTAFFVQTSPDDRVPKGTMFHLPLLERPEEPPRDDFRMPDVWEDLVTLARRRLAEPARARNDREAMEAARWAVSQIPKGPNPDERSRDEMAREVARRLLEGSG